jgi:hypothetical protein
MLMVALLIMTKRSLVCLVDDDESVRESLPDLLQHIGFAVHAFSSAEAFLASEALSGIITNASTCPGATFSFSIPCNPESVTDATAAMKH